MLAFLSAALSPHHYHLHHVADAGALETGSHAHEYAVVVHGHAAMDVGHDDGTHELGAASEVALKSPGPQLPWVTVLLTVLLLMPFFGRYSCRLPRAAHCRLPRFDRRNIPPLRAPPRTCFL